VRAAGFAPRYADRLELADEAESRLADLRLEPGVVLEGRVVDSRGKPVAGAELLVALDATAPAAGGGITLPGHGIPLAESATDGSFRVDELAPGPWRILVDAPDHAISEEEGRTERAGERVQGLVFRLERGFEILGRVRTRTVAGARGPARRRAAEPERAEGRDASAAPGAEDRSPTRRTLARAPRSRLPTARSSCAASARTCATSSRSRRRATTPANGSARAAPSRSRPSPDSAASSSSTARRQPSSSACSTAGPARRSRRSRSVPESGRTGRARSTRAGRSCGRSRGARAHRRAPAPARFPGVVLRVSAAGFKDLVRKDIALAPGQELDLGDLRLDPERVVTARVVDGVSGAPVEGARVLLGDVSDEEILARWARRPTRTSGRTPRSASRGRTRRASRASRASPEPRSRRARTHAAISRAIQIARGSPTTTISRSSSA
jgi:hypothetical protein